MLRAAGLQFETATPDVDEAEMKSRNGGLGAPDLALLLAKEKAISVSRNNPHATVIGSDQTLQCGQKQLSKPETLASARDQLAFLRGKKHQLYSAVAVAKNSNIIWSTCESADLKMRSFSDEFLNEYLFKEGQYILSCVGSYRIESLGIQLFHEVRGSHDVILGMPLLPLLQCLRQHGHILS